MKHKLLLMKRILPKEERIFDNDNQSVSTQSRVFSEKLMRINK